MQFAPTNQLPADTAINNLITSQPNGNNKANMCLVSIPYNKRRMSHCLSYLD